MLPIFTLVICPQSSVIISTTRRVHKSIFCFKNTFTCSDFCYGLSRFLLTYGDRKIAKQFIELVDKSLTYTISQTNEDGVIKASVLYPALNNPLRVYNVDLSQKVLSPVTDNKPSATWSFGDSRASFVALRCIDKCKLPTQRVWKHWKSWLLLENSRNFKGKYSQIFRLQI